MYYSFEIFPPKRTSSVDTIYRTIGELRELKPDFISVTFGAGGSDNSDSTVKIAIKVKEYGIEPMTHLPCINFSKEEVLNILGEFKNNNIRKILALRGDKNPDNPNIKQDFKFASELVRFIRENTGDFFEITGACYPEIHNEAANSDTDIDNLKKKVDEGVTSLITQLFFDNNVFYEFLNKIRKKNINVPVYAGIMPVTNKSQIERMVTLCGVRSFPHKFSKIMSKYAENSQVLTDAGINYAIDQITDLIAGDVDGIHLYTMNNPYVAKKITTSIQNLI